MRQFGIEVTRKNSEMDKRQRNTREIGGNQLSSARGRLPTGRTRGLRARFFAPARQQAPQPKAHLSNQSLYPISLSDDRRDRSRMTRQIDVPLPILCAIHFCILDLCSRLGMLQWGIKKAANIDVRWGPKTRPPQNPAALHDCIFALAARAVVENSSKAKRPLREHDVRNRFVKKPSWFVAINEACSLDYLFQKFAELVQLFLRGTLQHSIDSLSNGAR